MPFSLSRSVSLLAKSMLLALATTVIFATAGCGAGNLAGAGAGISDPVSGAAITGKAFGGQQAISGATVDLRQVGTTGYGTGSATILTTSPAVTAADGSFTISGDYTCPSPSTLVYLTIAGGNSGGGTNGAILLMTPLGACGSLSGSTFILVNEVTTVAAAYALGNYYTTSGGIGSPNTTQAKQGLTNAFATVNTLVNTSTGIANTSLTFGTAAPTVTFTPTSGGTGAVAKATAANGGILSVTVTTPGTGYTTAPTVAISGTTGTAATATAVLSGTTVASVTVNTAGTGYGAGVVTATPESTKLNTLANIIAACVNVGNANVPSGACATLEASISGPPASDTMQAAVDMALNPTAGSTANLTALYGLQNGFSPYQSDVGSQPTDLTLGIQYTDTTASLIDPQLALPDSKGNIWIMNHNSTTAAGLAELSPTGTPLTSTIAVGGVNMTAVSPRGMAIDQNDNTYTTSSGTSPAPGSWIFEYNPTNTVNTAFGDPVTFSPYAPAFDASNNLFIGKGSGSASSPTEFDEFVSGTLASTSLVEWPHILIATYPSNPMIAAIDTSGNVYGTNTSTSGEITYFEVMTNYSTTGCNTPYPCTTGNTETYVQALSATGNVPTLSTPWGLAAGPNGVMWVANNVGNTITQMTSPTAGANFGSATSLNKPESLAVDGAGNVWSGSFVSSPGTIEELSSTGTVLSQINSGTAPFNVIGYPRASLASETGIAVDPSGNVWVANNTTSTGNGLFELVGAGVPTITPIALALKGSPIVTITGGGGSGATAYASASGGVVTSIVVTNPGTGYTGTPSVTITSTGTGTGATATANITANAVATITVNTGGSGYTGVASRP